jgi:catalase
MTEDVPQGGELHRQLIAAMSDLSGGPHEGRRTVHAKGVWAEGTFTATPEATALSSASQLTGDTVPALIRFSKASGKPDQHDASRDGGGMAVKLRTESDEWDIVATGPPVFVARTPEDFLELLRLRKPDPETGQPDMEALGEFLGRHPEAQLAIQSTLGAEPPASFVTVPYFSPHAFALVAGDGKQTWVRWSWRPGAGEERLPDEEARERGRNYLREELEARLAAGPATMELIFQLAGEDDSLTDPTELWPAERESFVAARLEVTALVEDPEGDGHIEVFDPTRLPDGIEPSDDPILHARPRAYSVSAYHRLGQDD